MGQICALRNKITHAGDVDVSFLTNLIARLITDFIQLSLWFTEPVEVGGLNLNVLSVLV